MIIPKLQIEPNTCYVVSIAIVIFFKFGNDRENELPSASSFCLFGCSGLGPSPGWLGRPPSPNHSTAGQSQRRLLAKHPGPWETCADRQPRTQMTGAFSGSTGLLWG